MPPRGDYSLRRAVQILKGCLVIVLLQGSKSSSSIVLRASAPLLIAKVLPCIGGEEAWR